MLTYAVHKELLFIKLSQLLAQWFFVNKEWDHKVYYCETRIYSQMYEQIYLYTLP